MPAYNARSRTRGAGIMRPARQRVAGSNAAFNVLIVLLPKDVSELCVLQRLYPDLKHSSPMSVMKMLLIS